MSYSFLSFFWRGRRCGFETESHYVGQAGLKSWSSCFRLLSAGITAVFHYARQQCSLLAVITHLCTQVLTPPCTPSSSYICLLSLRSTCAFSCCLKKTSSMVEVSGTNDIFDWGLQALNHTTTASWFLRVVATFDQNFDCKCSLK
jgi:hypothetical protein